MIIYLGKISIWLALILSLIQFLITSKKNSKIFHNQVIVIGLLALTFISFFSLIYSHIVSDFRLINVFQNSHTSKPLIYKISGVWGNHEGSLLLWILVLTIINYFISIFYNKNNQEFISKTLQTQSIIIIGFIFFLIFTSNPFETLDFNVENGLGFNPILQDPALAIHPPLLYFGYVGLSAVFSFSLAALSLKKNSDKILWYKFMKPFVLSSWIFLTSGIAIGSLWAYYELGWGGWWFWDPVENAALMPWLLSTALLHSISTVQKKRSLQTWVLLLSILAFLLSLIGTFLVRSGILTSVHTFAIDPERGIYILVFISILGSYSLLKYIFQSKYFYTNHNFSFLSKEGTILINNLIMIIVCATVFFGTIFPLFYEIFTTKRISVGEPYFNSTIIPIMTPALIIMGLVPFLNWNKNYLKNNRKYIIFNLTMIIFVNICLFYIYEEINYFGITGISLSVWIIINLFASLFNELKKNKSLQLIKNINGMFLAHLGVALLIIGITGSSVWQKELITRLNINDEIIFNENRIILKDIDKIIGPNFIAYEGNFQIFDKNRKYIGSLKPQNRLYVVTNNASTEVSIHTNFIRDLYIVLGESDEIEGWVVRIYYNPLVIWIWIGSFIICLGGVLSLRKSLIKI